MTPQARIGTSLDDTMKLRRVERVLLLIGLVLLAVWGAARLYRVIGSRAAIARFQADRFAPAVASSEAGITTA